MNLSIRSAPCVRTEGKPVKLWYHIGLNGVDPAAYNGWEGDLCACDDDATMMAVLLAQRGYAAQALYDADAKRAALQEVLAGAAGKLIAGDWFVLSFSGHGGQQPAWTFSLARETICLYDGQMCDAELHNLLTAFQPGVNVVVILDSCHSGGMDRNPSGPRIRFAPTHVTERCRPAPVARSGDVACNLTFFTACRAGEYASDGDKNGAFTSSILACQGEPATQAWGELAAGVKGYMLKTYPAQHPQWLPVSGQPLDAAIVGA